MSLKNGLTNAKNSRKPGSLQKPCKPAQQANSRGNVLSLAELGTQSASNISVPAKATASNRRHLSSMPPSQQRATPASTRDLPLCPLVETSMGGRRDCALDISPLRCDF